VKTHVQSPLADLVSAVRAKAEGRPTWAPLLVTTGGASMLNAIRLLPEAEGLFEGYAGGRYEVFRSGQAGPKHPSLLGAWCRALLSRP
jgi:hypothetical protein